MLWTGRVGGGAPHRGAGCASIPESWGFSASTPAATMPPDDWIGGGPPFPTRSPTASELAHAVLRTGGAMPRSGRGRSRSHAHPHPARRDAHLCRPAGGRRRGMTREICTKASVTPGASPRTIGALPRAGRPAAGNRASCGRCAAQSTPPGMRLLDAGCGHPPGDSAAGRRAPRDDRHGAGPRCRVPADRRAPGPAISPGSRPTSPRSSSPRPPSTRSGPSACSCTCPMATSSSTTAPPPLGRSRRGRSSWRAPGAATCRPGASRLAPPAAGGPPAGLLTERDRETSSPAHSSFAVDEPSGGASSATR